MHICRGRAHGFLLVNAADDARVFTYQLCAQKIRENTYILHDFIKQVHLVRAGSEDKKGVELLTCIFDVQM